MADTYGKYFGCTAVPPMSRVAWTPFTRVPYGRTFADRVLVPTGILRFLEWLERYASTTVGNGSRCFRTSVCYGAVGNE